MRHTDKEIADAAERFERWADDLDVDGVEVERVDDLRAIAEAADAVAAAEARLREAVEVARARGRSWNLVAIPLGTSRQAARQRFRSSGADDMTPVVDLMAALDAALAAEAKKKAAG